MDKDTVIAVVLAVILVGLFFALLGVVAVTGYFLATAQPQVTEKAPVEEKSLVDTLVTDKNAGTDQNVSQDQNKAPDANTNLTPPAPVAKAAPVCGNKTKEEGEQCEVDSDCSAEQVCTSCKCEPKPKTGPPKLEKLVLQSITYHCAPNLKKGLYAKTFVFKNNDSADFVYDKPIELSAFVVDQQTDSVKTKHSTSSKLTVKPSKTAEIQYFDIDRAAEPFVFLGNKTGVPAKITASFGETGYAEYNTTLTFQDFSSVGCQ